jgi:hypothetical protein
MADSILQKFLKLRAIIPSSADKKEDIKKNKTINKQMKLENDTIDIPVIQQIIDNKPKNKIVVEYLQNRLNELNDAEMNN